MVKKSSKIKKISTDYESGVTLLIAIIMLASVMFISLSLSSVVLREIGATRQVLQTEPAITGSDAGGEVGLYAVLRQTGLFSEQRTLPQSGVSYDFQTDQFDSPYVFTIPAGSLLEVRLYEPEDPANAALDYGTLAINGLSGTVNITVYSYGDIFNAMACSGSAGSGTPFSCPLSSADDRYLVVVDPSNDFAALTGQMDTTNAGGQAKGVPAISPTIVVTGTLNDVQRKIEVNLTEPPP